MRSLFAIVLGACTPSSSGTSAPPTLNEVPMGLEDTCAANQRIGLLTLATPADYLVLRRATDFGPPIDVESVGVPCATATTPETCLATLGALVPSSTGWGYCGEGCWDEGLILTRGDAVEMADSPDAVAAWLSPIDTVADALFIATTLEHTGECDTVRISPDQSYLFDATIMTSDCPVTHERRRLRIDRDGMLIVLDVLAVDVTDDCI